MPSKSSPASPPPSQRTGGGGGAVASPGSRRASRKIDSAAAAKALNSSSSPTSGSGTSAARAGTAERSSGASSTGSIRGRPSDTGSIRGRGGATPRDRRSLNSSTASDRLPTTRVSVTSPDRTSIMSSSTNGDAAAPAIGALAPTETGGSEATAAAVLSRGASAADEPKHAKQASGAATDDNSDTASVRSNVTLKTIRNGSTGANSGGGKGGPASAGLLLLPSASTDDNDIETGAIDIHAWSSAPSAGVGAPARDHEGNVISTDPIELSRWRRRVLLRTAIRLFILFVLCSVALVGTLWIALPKIDEKDRPFLKIPKSLTDLKALNEVLQHYKDENNARVLLCWVVVYMFLQAFSIPGSMYMSILAGALWGVFVALPLVCAAVATGATICYLISQTMGEALIAVPKWKARVDSWKDRLAQYNDNLLSYLILIRMMPLPPHNVVNLLAPHMGISIPMFWISTALGIFAVSFIHTTIGEKLDDMASSDDFHLLSVRNALLFLGVCGAVVVPILVRKRAPVAPLEEADDGPGAVRLPDDDEEDYARSRRTPSSVSAAASSVAGVGRTLLGIGQRGLGLRGRDDANGGRAEVGDDFDADYDEDADELPPVSNPDQLAAVASLSRANSFNSMRHAKANGSSARPKPARVLRPPGPPGPEDIEDEDPTEAWRNRPFGTPPIGAGPADESDSRSEDSHLSAPFSDDRREDRGPGRERGSRSGANRSGRGSGSRPDSWAGRAQGVAGDMAGRVRTWFGGGGNGVVLR
ncbi:hypothetical protein V8E36_005780 [Tilletia maclaganii]